MRTRLSVLIGALLFTSTTAWAQATAPAVATSATPTPAAQAAAAQTPAAEQAAEETPVPYIVGEKWQKGTFSVGFVGSSVTGDRARYERYRDLRDGAAADVFRYRYDQGAWFVDTGADHLGRRDQRYFFNVARPGKVKASFEWNQIPLLYSNDTATIYTNMGGGVFRIDDAIQQGIENKQLTLPGVIDRARGFTTRNRRDTATLKLLYSATPDVDLKFDLQSYERSGSQPWAAPFGFSLPVELPLPIDSRTTDVNTGVEWENGKALLAVGYAGSWYKNRVQTLTWDNPIRFTDRTYSSAYSPGDGTSQGRMAISPSNSMNSVQANGYARLPSRSVLAAFFSVGTFSQDEALLPHTINTAIPTIPLERATAQAENRVVSANVNFSSRPASKVFLNARFRSWDMKDRTPTFNGEEYVRFDQVYEETGHHRAPLSIKRQNFDIDASFAAAPYTSFKIGYGRAATNRTSRIFNDTTENTLRASVDTTGNAYLSLRTLYEHSVRRGSGFNLHVLEEAGQQPGARQFDVANRDRDRLTLVATVTPIEALGVNLSVGAGKDDYVEAEFGLRDNKNTHYSAGFDVMPVDRPVTFSFDYGYEKYTALQTSRTTLPPPNAQFTDARRNWSLDSADRTHNVMSALTLERIIPNTDIRFAYDYTDARSTFVYSLPANTVLPTPEAIAPVTYTLQRGTLDTTYFFTKNVGVGVVYWYDKYDVTDYAYSSAAVVNRAVQGAGMFLGYMYRPYTANTVWGRLTFLW